MVKGLCIKLMLVVFSTGPDAQYIQWYSECPSAQVKFCVPKLLGSRYGNEYQYECYDSKGNVIYLGRGKPVSYG